MACTLARKTSVGVFDGSIGEASIFHATFGYYAQGVSETTAILPNGWRDRLRRLDSLDTGGVVAWCLDAHDLWISKAIANREKDVEFCQALLTRGIVQRDTLRSRLEALPDLEEKRRRIVARHIDREE